MSFSQLPRLNQPKTSLEQTSFRFYEDGTETGATAIAAQNTNITRDVNSDSNLQLRIGLEETNNVGGLSGDDFQLQYELNDSGTYYNIGSGATSTANYYFNNSVAGPNDPGGVWTNEANIFDNNDSTSGGTTTFGTKSSNYVESKGTNAPGSGNTITLVEFRIRYDDGSSTSWSTYKTITAPGGSWSWTKVQQLETRIWLTNATTGGAEVYAGGDSGGTALVTETYLDDGGGGAAVFGVEVRVTSSSSIPVISYNSASLTDGNATTNRLGSGGITVVEDNFDDNSIDSTKWTNWGGGQVTETSNQIQIVNTTVNGAAYGMDTKWVGNFTNSYVQMQIVDDGTPQVSGQIIPVQVTLSSGNAVYWYVENGTAYCMKAVASVYTQVGSSRTHTDGDYYRVRESGGTTYWDYSTDGITWTNQTSQSNPITLTTVYISFLTYNAATVSSTTVKLDNFKLAFGNFVAGEISEDGLVDNSQLTAGNYTEHLYALTIDSDAVANNDTIDFRVLRNGAVIDTYSVTPRITVSKSASVSVTPGVASLTTTTFAPTVFASDNKAVTTASPTALTTTTFAPTVTINNIVTPDVASLTTTTFAPTVTASDNKVVTPDTASLTTSAFAPTVEATDNKTVAPDTASLTTSLFAPTATVSDNKFATPDTASLATTTYAPTVTVSDNITLTPGVASLTTSTFAPTVTVSDNIAVTPSAASLATTTYAPTATASDNKQVTPDVASLTTNTFAPTVVINTIVTPDAASLTTALFAPTVNASDNKEVTPGTASLVTSTFAPTATTTDNVAATPSTASLTTTAYAPTVVATDNKTAAPDTASLTTSTFAPSVAVSDNKFVTPGTASLSTSTFAPSVVATDNKVATPDTASLTTSTFAPTVTATDNVTVTPDTASLTLSTFTLSVTTGDNKEAVPGTTSLTLTTFVPAVAVSDNKLATPGVASLTLTAFSPTVVASDNKTATPGTASLTTTTFAPTVAATDNQTATPGTAALTLSTFTPSVTVGDNKEAVPGTATLTLSAFAPDVAATANVTLEPGAASVSLSTFAPSVTASDNKTVSPGAASLTLAAFAPTVGAGQNTYVTPGTAQLRLRASRPIVNGIIPEQKLYFDTDGNAYYVISQSAALVERI